jgi:hypothetical protein
VPGGNRPIELAWVELRQQRERQTERHAIVICRGLEAIAQRYLDAIERQRIGIVLRYELLFAAEHVADREAQDLGVLPFRRLAPGLERLAVHDRLGDACVEEREQRVIVREHVALARLVAQPTHLRDQRAVLLLERAAALVLPAHQRVLQEHEPGAHGRHRGVVHAAIAKHR